MEIQVQGFQPEIRHRDVVWRPQPERPRRGGLGGNGDDRHHRHPLDN